MSRRLFTTAPTGHGLFSWQLEHERPVRPAPKPEPKVLTPDELARFKAALAEAEATWARGEDVEF